MSFEYDDVQMHELTVVEENHRMMLTTRTFRNLDAFREIQRYPFRRKGVLRVSQAAGRVIHQKSDKQFGRAFSQLPVIVESHGIDRPPVIRNQKRVVCSSVNLAELDNFVRLPEIDPPRLQAHVLHFPPYSSASQLALFAHAPRVNSSFRVHCNHVVRAHGNRDNKAIFESLKVQGHKALLLLNVWQEAKDPLRVLERNIDRD